MRSDRGNNQTVYDRLGSKPMINMAIDQKHVMKRGAHAHVFCSATKVAVLYKAWRATHYQRGFWRVKVWHRGKKYRDFSGGGNRESSTTLYLCSWKLSVYNSCKACSACLHGRDGHSISATRWVTVCAFRTGKLWRTFGNYFQLSVVNKCGEQHTA